MQSFVLQERIPTEFFKEVVESAMVRQDVRACDLTGYYLVNLLCKQVMPDPETQAELGEPLAVRLARALQSYGSDQKERLRRLGDFSLFTVGFFSDSLKRQQVDVDYYVSMGQYAYGTLSQEESNFRAAYAELARKFVPFTDVLAEVSERSVTTSPNHDLLRTYEKWLRTGSPRNEKHLIARGILPNRSVGKKFLQ
jgi:hypothetical protein